MQQDSNYRRVDFAHGYYGLIDTHSRELWLYDAAGTFVGCYCSIRQASTYVRCVAS